MLYVVGQIFNGKELAGYRLLYVESRETVDVPLSKLRAICSKQSVKFENAIYKSDVGILIGTQGSLVGYQSIYTNGNLFGKKKIAICYKIIDSTTNKLGGYGVTDGYGMLVNVTTEKLIDICGKYDLGNFELVRDKVSNNVVAKSLGADFKSVKMTLVKPVKGYNSKLGEAKVCSEVKDSKQSNQLPTLVVYSYDDIKDNEFAMQAQEKMFQAILNMKRLSPYYHTILMAVKKEVTTAIETMGVTEDTMYYNLKFIAGLTVAEVTFVLIHEISHLAMRHSVRHGNRDNELWNIATDLYINSIIAKDFDCYYGQSEKEYTTKLGKAVFKVPLNGIHLSTINEVLDFGVDTPETIYARLLKENPIKEQSQQGKGNGGSSSKSENNSSSGDNQNSGSSSSSKDNSSKNGDEKDKSSGSDNSDGDSSSEGNPFKDDSSEGNVNKSRSSLAQDGTEVDQKADYEGIKTVSVTYNGKKLTGTMSMDIMTSEIGDNQDRNQRMDEKALSTTQAMKTAVEIKEEKDGEKLTKNAGDGAGLIRRCIEFGLSNQVNWKVLLANMCKASPKKAYTLGNPNEVYMNSGITVASRRKIGKPTAIKGIKICVDISGSVSKEDLSFYLSEVDNILRRYKVDGELIYWSTMIGDAGKFSDLKGMLKVKPISSGGTDVKCVFDYLSGKTRVNSNYESDSIKDISCVIIFTDGCFSTNYEEYAKYFGKKVIWVITDSNFMFNPPFGKIALMKN